MQIFYTLFLGWNLQTIVKAISALKPRDYFAVIDEILLWNSKQYLKFLELQFILYMWFWNWDCFKKLLIFKNNWRLWNVTLINHNSFAFRKCNKKVELLFLVIWTIFRIISQRKVKVWKFDQALKQQNDLILNLYVYFFYHLVYKMWMYQLQMHFCSSSA